MSTKLPRIAHADRPRPDETVRKQTSADLQNGWLGRHGTLTMTDDRLVFVPTILDTALRAKRREIILDALTEIERWPVRPNVMPLGGKRPRMRLHTPECVYEFMVPDLDGWIDALEKMYELRAKAGRPHRPLITREGYTNLLTAEA